jgi:hypothetical protein
LRHASKTAAADDIICMCVCVRVLAYSAVTPLLNGTRQVLVVELWQGEERRCPHRCVQHWAGPGGCGFGDGCGDGDGAVRSPRTNIGIRTLQG